MSDNSENAAVGHGGERDMARDIEASSIASHIDLFFDELHRIDVAYSDYARRAGVSDNVMCILDYLKDHDGASQRAICEYTLLPRQTVNNVIASFVAHGFVELGDAEGRSSGQNGPFHACRAQILQQLDRAESRRGVSGDERAS